MTAPAIRLAPDAETHERIVAWENLARANARATFGPAVLLALCAQLRSARMAAHVAESALAALEVENDELSEQLPDLMEFARRVVRRTLSGLSPQASGPPARVDGYLAALSDAAHAIDSALRRIEPGTPHAGEPGDRMLEVAP